VAVKFVADMVVPVEIPVKVPPFKVKKSDKVEDIGVPFLYISLQFILPETSNMQLDAGFVKPIPTLPDTKYVLLLISFLQKLVFKVK
jgi:hypothetical protein